MANTNSLPKKEVDQLFYKLCLAISKNKKVEEAADFMRDLLSYSEAEMIAKRLKIAELLLEKNSYEDIRKELKVGHGTIARVNEWLKISGDGYRETVKKIKGKNKELKVKKELPTVELNVIKKRYPMYYWPEIVLDNIIKNSNKKQKEKLERVIRQMEKMKKKTNLYHKLKRLL